MRAMLSGIIPFHNVDLYPAACVDSMIQQTFDRPDGLLDDDGSTDTSRELVADFLRKDNRIPCSAGQTAVREWRATPDVAGMRRVRGFWRR